MNCTHPADHTNTKAFGLMGETEIDDAATQSHSGDPRVTIAHTIRIKQIQIKQTSNSDKNINGAQQSADQQPGQAHNC